MCEKFSEIGYVSENSLRRIRGASNQFPRCSGPFFQLPLFREMPQSRRNRTTCELIDIEGNENNTAMRDAPVPDPAIINKANHETTRIPDTLLRSVVRTSLG